MELLKPQRNMKKPGRTERAIEAYSQALSIAEYEGMPAHPFHLSVIEPDAPRPRGTAAMSKETRVRVARKGGLSLSKEQMSKNGKRGSAKLIEKYGAEYFKKLSMKRFNSKKTDRICPCKSCWELKVKTMEVGE
jgi:hypothetical protein